MWKWIKRGILSMAMLTALLVLLTGVCWYTLDLDGQPLPDPASTVADLDFMRHPAPARGKVLAVATRAML